MKKTYHTPAIYYESFQLAQNISVGCEGIANFDGRGCSIDVTELNINIHVDVGVCQYTGPTTDDMICYHAPSDMNNAFSS